MASLCQASEVSLYVPLFPSEMAVTVSVPRERFWGCACACTPRRTHGEDCGNAVVALAQRCWATCAPREDVESVYSNIMATAMKLFFNH